MVNGGSYTTVSGNETDVTISNQGNNTLEYYATDNAGNQESVNTEYVALDATPKDWLTNVSAMPTARYYLTASTVDDDSIYAIGGLASDLSTVLNTVEKYNVSNDSWSTVSSMPTARHQLGSAVVNNQVYTFGGRTVDGGSPVDTVEKYYPSNDSWSTVSSMPTAVRGASACSIEDSIYVIGGYDGSNSRKIVQKYNVSTSSWTTVSNMNTARYYFDCASVGNDIYVAGGLDSGLNPTSSVEKYNVSNDSWSTLSNMSIPRRSSSLGVNPNENLYVFGGSDNEGVVYATSEKYYPSNDSWTSGPALNTDRRDMGSAVGLGNIYAFGGYDGTSVLSSMEYLQFDYDNTPPISSDNWTETGFSADSSVDIRLNASDVGGSGVQSISYRVNGGSYTTVSDFETVVTISSEGNNTLEYYATDNNGNQESVNTEYVALDSTSPSISFNSGTTEGEVNQTYILVNVSASDQVSGLNSVTENFEGGETVLTQDSDGYYVENHTGLTDGTYEFFVTAEDNAGNINTTSTRTVTINVNGTDTGGGGGTGVSDEETVYFGSTRTESGLETFDVDFGETSVKNLSITNPSDEDLTVDISAGSEGFCGFVSVRPSLGSSEWSGSGSYQVSSGESVDTQVRFDLPKRSVVESRGVSNFSCSFSTLSNYGVAESLVVKAKPSLSLESIFDSLGLDQEFCITIPSAEIDENGEIVDTTSNVCQPLAVWLGLVALFLVFVYVAVQVRRGKI